MIQDIKRSKPSLREVLPKTNSAAAGDGVRRPGDDHEANNYELTINAPMSQKRWWWFGLGGVVIILVIAWLATQFWGQALVTIYPRVLIAEVNARLVANAESAAAPLAYQLITLEGSLEQTLSATETDAEPTPASGLITVYNNHSASPQNLIARTRFESPEGKIYRISKPITVPGYRKVDGQIEPGAIEVMVTADEPGAEQNIGPTKFTIPGFKGDPRFENFYAESKESFTGGGSGARLLPADSDLQTARQTMLANLETKLLADARSSVPAEMIVYPIASMEAQEKIEPAGTTQVTVTENASWTAAVFRRVDLSDQLVRSLLGYEIPANPVVLNLDDLKFVVLTEGVSGENLGQLTFDLSGRLLVASDLQADEIRTALVGAERSRLDALILEDKRIEKYDLRFRPPWLWGFPDDSESIKIEISQPSINES